MTTSLCLDPGGGGDPFCHKVSDRRFSCFILIVCHPMLRAFFFSSNAITVHVCGWNLANAEVKTSVGDPWHFGADPDPRIHSSPLNNGSGSDSFLQWLYGCEKTNNFSYFFSYNLPTGKLSSVLKILFFAKILYWNFILQPLFRSAQHIYEKREGSGSGSVPLTSGSGSRRPKNIRIPNTSQYSPGFGPQHPPTQWDLRRGGIWSSVHKKPMLLDEGGAADEAVYI